MDGKVDLKVCGVCGDKALGYNFNAVTCESCKAFFRRNALAKKDFRCPFNEQCQITTVTRRFCQKCRLDKCFSIGMRKDYIMSEQDKVLKRQKIEENRAKKRTNTNSNCDDRFRNGFKKMRREAPVTDDDSLEYDGTSDCSETLSPVTEPALKTDANPNSAINYIYPEHNVIPDTGNGVNECDLSGSSITDESMIRTMLNPTPNGSLGSNEDPDSPGLTFLLNNNDINCNMNSSSFSKPANDDTAKKILEDVQRIPIEANSIESILCEAIKLEYEAYTSMGTYQSTSRDLNDAERAKLNELIVANKALLTPVDDDLSSLISNDSGFKSKPELALLSNPALVDVINLTAVAIRRLIKMAKKINAFKNMCQEDQVALLKGGCTEMMMLRSLMNYDMTKQTWNIPHRKEYLSSLKADVLKQAKGFYQEHERFIKTFDPKWRSDENVVLILCAITLFTPDRPKVIHHDVIKLEQNSYYYLLRRYLESVYPGCEAKSTFLKLIQKISDLHKLNEEVINCYLNVNPSEVEPLLIEIFDITH